MYLAAVVVVVVVVVSVLFFFLEELADNDFRWKKKAALDFYDGVNALRTVSFVRVCFVICFFIAELAGIIVLRPYCTICCHRLSRYQLT